MNQSLLTPGLVLIVATALMAVVVPTWILWLAMTHAGVGAVTATFCAALVAAAGCWAVFVVGRVLVEESWRCRQ